MISRRGLCGADDNFRLPEKFIVYMKVEGSSVRSQKHVIGLLRLQSISHFHSLFSLIFSSSENPGGDFP
jgi:hypothetical protein